MRIILLNYLLVSVGCVLWLENMYIAGSKQASYRCLFVSLQKSSMTHNRLQTYSLLMSEKMLRLASQACPNSRSSPSAGACIATFTGVILFLKGT